MQDRADGLWQRGKLRALARHRFAPAKPLTTSVAASLPDTLSRPLQQSRLQSAPTASLMPNMGVAAAILACLVTTCLMGEAHAYPCSAPRTTTATTRDAPTSVRTTDATPRTTATTLAGAPDTTPARTPHRRRRPRPPLPLRPRRHRWQAPRRGRATSSAIRLLPTWRRYTTRQTLQSRSSFDILTKFDAVRLVMEIFGILWLRHQWVRANGNVRTEHWRRQAPWHPHRMRTIIR